MSTFDIEVPVLIVGGSLVGMSTAMLLAHHGVSALTVEHHRGTAIHPRAALINQRTMEIFRTVGVEQIVMQKSGEQFDQDGAVMAVETLAGKEIAYFIPNLNEGVRDVSPTVRVFITQRLLEPLLKSRAQKLGAQLRLQHRDDVVRAGRGRSDGADSRSRQRQNVHRAGALPGGGGWQPEPDSRELGHWHARARRVFEQRDDLFPRRCGAAAARDGT